MAQMIETIEGLLDISVLSKVESFETVPCGTGKTTNWLHNGKIVRQDYEVTVSPEAYAAGLAAGANL